MFWLVQSRIGHYLLLVTLSASLFLPGLGQASLWDIDEGHNAEAAREMLDADDWVRPTFNYELRVDKPALLYWLQILGYQCFGVSEFAARLPSALAGILIVLLTYELGRRLYDPGAGLLAGLILPSALLFCGAAHFANPDALLVCCNVLTFIGFWLAYDRRQPAWLVLAGLGIGLGILAKGPVAIVLPWAAVLLFALWSRQFRWLLQIRWLLAAGLLILIVAAPWYVLVGTVTKGEFLTGFFMRHNVERFQAPMEGHHGSMLYYPAILIVGLLPWSAFLGSTLWYGIKEARQGDDRSAAAGRFLLCWLIAYVAFFSISRTKLPNYILPVYPAVALLTGRFLERWRQGQLELVRWVMPSSLLVWSSFGVGAIVALVFASGLMPLEILKGRVFPDLRPGVALGGVLLVGALAAGWLMRRDHRPAALASLAGSAALFVGILHAWGAPTLDHYKPARALVQAANVRQLDQDIRVGTYQWYQPSVVFYSQRKVHQLLDEQKALEFLQYPLPVYLFMPRSIWHELRPRTDGSYRQLASHWDLYRACEVVVITNR